MGRQDPTGTWYLTLRQTVMTTLDFAGNVMPEADGERISLCILKRNIH